MNSSRIEIKNRHNPQVAFVQFDVDAGSPAFPEGVSGRARQTFRAFRIRHLRCITVHSSLPGAWQDQLVLPIESISGFPTSGLLINHQRG